MKNNRLNAVLPHLVVVIIFLLIAILYCKPVLDGKVLSQHDSIQWQGMAHEALQYKEQHGIPPLWTVSMFGGMPTYQIAVESPYHIGEIIPKILSLGLPIPINFLFLAAVGFYLLCIVLRVRPWIAFIGAIAYAYASYNVIIIAAGHDTKMLAMCYMPAVLAGVLLILRKKYFLGTGLTALFMIYLIGANHLQITYYFFLLLGMLGIAYAVYCIREKQVKHLLISGALIALAAMLGVASNLMLMWTTYEYSHESIRGGQSELSPLAEQKGLTTTGGLDKTYAFRYSVGQLETFTFLVPNLMGSSDVKLTTSSNTYKELTTLGIPPVEAERMIQQWPMYWGNQPWTSATYLGAIICFLAVLGFILTKSWHRWWILAITILSILMMWGDNLASFNYFLFDHLPFYNKFRAPSIIVVLPQLTFALLAVMGLNELITAQSDKKELFKNLKLAGMITGGLLVLLLIMSTSLSFTNISNDPEHPRGDDRFKAQLVQMSQGNTTVVDTMMRALREDRASLYRSDVIRSAVLVGLAFLLLWLFLKGKVNGKVMTGGLAVLVLFDLLQIDRRFVDDSNFVEQSNYRAMFQPSPADQQILQDKDPYYRVYNLAGDPFNDAMTSYFHKSIGGYHAAKLQLYQDLIERQIAKNNIQVLNMLNTKYVIQAGQDGQPVAQRNPEALGNAWFVKGIVWAANADAEMQTLDHMNTRDSVVIDQRFKSQVTTQPVFDSSATIQLKKNDLNSISYTASSTKPQFAVFSEIYYKAGWHAYIDGKEVPYARVNYALRGLMVPAGKHEIAFRFEPASYYKGIKISLFSYIATLLLIAAGIGMAFRRKKEPVTA
ncbi:YfhO family protein [Chitinophaga pendula]|uniref:YfhO family protein n=1 Tax=Chitinophaga TaxID=79328 RepID=UPI000BB00631|nr:MULTISPECIES: YfhO family protein [Chitinophaga]ASZ12191.1 hypothetical protein CK934_15095 [Chitinophaga sp. MD30]UCJ04782.1 YfhO family protein [Chitinophaga pendula]